jgi:putative restriction endonuclease
MQGAVANTDRGWYEFLLNRPDIEEVNFWSPSPRRAFRGEPMVPFFFRLKAPDNAIAGFAFFARYERLPVWLAWEAFGAGNGVESSAEFGDRLATLRDRIRYEAPAGPDEIGCIILLEPVLFPEELWVPVPSSWKPRTQAYRFYDLSHGEGKELWTRCRSAARELADTVYEWPSVAADRAARYGVPGWVRPRLGQGTFRVATMHAYERACAVTGEHSLPALEAAHIKPYAQGGSHDVRNGIFMRADLHRLFDRGYLTVGRDHRIAVSPRLREDYHNGRSYYPLAGQTIRVPPSVELQPNPDLLAWHNESVFMR